MRLSYKYRIYPNKEQEMVLQKNFNFCCFLYNSALQERKSYYKKYKKGLLYCSQAAELLEVKKEFKDQTDYYSWVHDMIEEIGGSKKAWKMITFNIGQRSIDIIHRRLVLGHTLEKVGQHYKVTRERIRQLEVIAMSAIKNKFTNNIKLELLIKRYGLKMKP